MPNIKSSAKRDEIGKARAAKNRADRSLMRTNLKKFEQSVAAGNREAADSAYRVAVKTLDQAAAKNLIHKNNAANKKSKMAAKLNKLA